MAQQNKDLIFGVSLWGQGDDPFLLYSRDPIKSLKKCFVNLVPIISSEGGIHHFFTPAFTWSKRFLGGNLEGIVAANIKNFNAFKESVGLPDVLHAQASYPGAWIASELSKKYDVPYVVTLRMSPFPFPEYLKKGKLNSSLFKVLSNANRLLATSHSLKHRVRSFGLKNVEVVHNPVDLDFFTKQENDSFHQSIRLLSVGRLESQKGFDVLIRAMLKVSAEAHLDIIGEGTEHKKLQRQIDDLQLDHRVLLHGEKSRAEVRQFMQGADGYVLSSRHETFGNVLLEAMACGLPSVATRCGGPEDILLRPAIGLLCEPNDSDDLAASINQMIGADWQSKKIRLEAVQRFSPKIFTEDMIRIYLSAARGLT